MPRLAPRWCLTAPDLINIYINKLARSLYTCWHALRLQLQNTLISRARLQLQNALILARRSLNSPKIQIFDNLRHRARLRRLPHAHFYNYKINLKFYFNKLSKFIKILLF